MSEIAGSIAMIVVTVGTVAWKFLVERRLRRRSARSRARYEELLRTRNDSEEIIYWGDLP